MSAGQARTAAANVFNGGKERIYESFVSFLRSPMWVLPVLSFVEQRSLVFDKEDADEQLFKQIHGEFRGMVDMLIQCFCDDMGIKPRDVAESIRRDHSNIGEIEQSILEPVVAAHDYNVFLHMMIRKNIELQLQALEMIQVVYGLIPSVLLPGGDGDYSRPAANGENEQERLIMIEVIRQSREDYEKERARNAQAQLELERAIELSLKEKDRLEKQHQKEQETMRMALDLTLNDKRPIKTAASNAENSRTSTVSGGVESRPATRATAAVAKAAGYGAATVGATAAVAGSERRKSAAASAKRSSDVPTTKPPMNQSTSVDEQATALAREREGLPPVKGTGKRDGMPDDLYGGLSSKYLSKEEQEEQQKKLSKLAEIRARLKEHGDTVSPELLKERQDYLRQQRDKLLNMKREAREKAFNDDQLKNKNSRPKTARAVKNILRGRPSELGKGEANDDVIAAREALMEKLKAEVIHQ